MIVKGDRQVYPDSAIYCDIYARTAYSSRSWESLNITTRPQTGSEAGEEERRGSCSWLSDALGALDDGYDMFPKEAVGLPDLEGDSLRESLDEIDGSIDDSTNELVDENG